jgi:four helix bundle protein
MDIAPQAPNINERTFAFAVSVVRFCQILVAKPGINRTLGQQLLRAGTSIGANLEEAQAAQSSADFISKCSISLKEARETIYWLRLLQATGQCENDDLRLLAQEADEISRIMGAIIVKTKTRRKDK